jgi:hypothetical protein
MMLYQDFPTPVSVLAEVDDEEGEAFVIVHRRVAIAHSDSRACECQPRLFTGSELLRIDCAQFNAMMGAQG